MLEERAVLGLESKSPLEVTTSPSSVGSSNGLIGDDAARLSASDEDSSARVALLLRADAAAVSALRERPHLRICAEATLRFFGANRRLIILRSTDTAPGATVASALASLCDEAEMLCRAGRPAPGCCDAMWMWPLHGSFASKRRLTTLDLLGPSAVVGQWWRWTSPGTRLQRLAIATGIWSPKGGRITERLLRDTYGPDSAYALAWSHWFVPHMWGAFLLSGVALALGVGPPDGRPRRDRWLWEAGKAALAVWSLRVAWVAQDGDEVLDRYHEPDLFATRVPNPLYRRECGTSQLRTVLLSVPVYLAFLALVSCVLLAQVQFNAWLAFVWGDCVHLDCDHPMHKHGLFGFVCQVGSDITMALTFELLKAVSHAIGGWVASVQNHEWRLDHDHAAVTAHVALESFGKIGAFAILAFTFVPQWDPPSSEPDDVLLQRCASHWSYALVGPASLFCLEKRLPQAKRERVFENSLTGPFVVYPFIEILMTAIVPFIANRLDVLMRETTLLCSCCDAIGDFVSRFLATIFVYDCDSIGCLRFTFRGWPYRNVQVKRHSGDALESQGQSNQEVEEMVHDALRQAVLRPFVALDELLELKLNFLSVAFFASPAAPSSSCPCCSPASSRATPTYRSSSSSPAGLSPPRPPSRTGRRAATLPSSPCSPWCGRWRSLS